VRRIVLRMISYSRSVAVFVAGAVFVTACSLDPTLDMSDAELDARGRKLLTEALQKSKVVSQRDGMGGGAVYVMSNIELTEDRYCYDLIAVRQSSPAEIWHHYDVAGTVRRQCRAYDEVNYLRPADVRHCDLEECLWIRGWK
jgi:hypothetical protein